MHIKRWSLENYFLFPIWKTKKKFFPEFWRLENDQTFFRTFQESAGILDKNKPSKKQIALKEVGEELAVDIKAHISFAEFTFCLELLSFHPVLLWITLLIFSASEMRFSFVGSIFKAAS